MLTHLSWPQFIQAVAILLFLYYAVVLAYCHRDRLMAFLTKGRGPRHKDVPAAPSRPFPTGGETAADAQPLWMDGAEIRVAPHTAAEDDFQPEILSALLDDLYTLLERAPKNKEGCCVLLRPILSHYRSQLPDRLREQVNSFLLDRLPFALTPAELEALWQ